MISSGVRSPACRRRATASTAACFATGGWEPALAGLRALREHRLDVDLLMIVAGLGAAAVGQLFDGGLLIVIFATSGALEAVATRRTRDSVRSLLTLAPQQATRRSRQGHEEIVDTTTLAAGDLVVVRPGESIGADGTLIEGASEVDQASITGEPLPVFRTVGDEVFAGTLNGEGAMVVRVSRAATESVVARIVAMVAEASATKARAQLFIERVEQRYSKGVVVATLALFFVPLALGSDLRTTLLKAMTFMIVASPCAVVLATMPPLLSAIANAGRHGVLVKSAVVMERLATTTLVAFDKTGTLTEGTPRVSEVLPLPSAGLDADELLSLAAAAELPSEHPLGRAVVAAAAIAHVDVRAGLLPQDKVGVVNELQSSGEHVLVVGDGVNDAPALAAAHLGVAMGRHGSDLALETADAVIVRDEVAVLPTVINLSRRARRIVVQNLAFAATAIVVLVTMDLFGELPLPLGVAGHEGSTILVGLNGLRLLRASAWRATGAPAPRRPQQLLRWPLPRGGGPPPLRGRCGSSRRRPGCGG